MNYIYSPPSFTRMHRTIRHTLVGALQLMLVAASLQLPVNVAAQSGGAVGYTPEQCPSCASWNAPHAPVRLFGNSYWVGTDGLGAILITSDAGHILIDGALPESAPHIEANVHALGFRMTDIRLILNSHAHYDHSGGIAALQRASGANVAATAASAAVLLTGRAAADDPQHDIALAFPTVGEVRVVADGDTLHVGPLAIVTHLTPGHSPGGTTWSWRSCEADRCLDMVYAESQSPVAAPNFRFSDGSAVDNFERGLKAIEGLACDVLVTPHPAASKLWERVAERAAGNSDALMDREACRRYAAQGRDQLSKRLARERGQE